MSVRVRYAPSPTGLQHIGGVRTALFNYFFARANKGTFILRIEDTDQGRYTDEALQDLYDTFAWLGIHWDEGPDVGGKFAPYIQSERTELYRKYAEQLVADGHAYYCYCTPERMEKLRADQAAAKSGQGYDRHCRTLSAAQIADAKASGISPVIRFKVPLEGSTTISDLLLGDIERGNADINPDPVLLKSDGFPTYHLANVIDGHFMEITHILRAQEWIPSGPLHVLLYQAFGWDVPKYCHLPMVMGTDGQKLSKRHGSTAVREFRTQGYLPEAIINYISLIGWSYDDSREFFSVKDLEELFSLEKLSKSPGVFDYKKLEWFNGSYIRLKTPQTLADDIVPWLTAEGIISDPPTAGEMTMLMQAIPLIQERLHLLSEAPAVVRFLFKGVGDYDPAELIPKKGTKETALKILQGVSDIIAAVPDGDEAVNEAAFRTRAEELGVKLGDLMMPIRVALTGSRVSPPLFGSISLLGKETSLDRVQKAIERLQTL